MRIRPVVYSTGIGVENGTELAGLLLIVAGLWRVAGVRQSAAESQAAGAARLRAHAATWTGVVIQSLCLFVRYSSSAP